MTFLNFNVGAADPDCDPFHKHRAVLEIRFWNIFEPCSPGFLRFHCNGFHLLSLFLRYVSMSKAADQILNCF